MEEKNFNLFQMHHLQVKIPCPENVLQLPCHPRPYYKAPTILLSRTDKPPNGSTSHNSSRQLKKTTSKLGLLGVFLSLWPAAVSFSPALANKHCSCSCEQTIQHSDPSICTADRSCSRIARRRQLSPWQKNGDRIETTGACTVRHQRCTQNSLNDVDACTDACGQFLARNSAL